MKNKSARGRTNRNGPEGVFGSEAPLSSPSLSPWKDGDKIMRFFAFAALAALSIGLFDARPASAASWSCVGPEVACGGARSTAKKASYKKAAYKKESYK